MIDSALTRPPGPGVLLNRCLQRVRAYALKWLFRIKRFVSDSSLKPLPRSQGERLVEHSVRVFGVPVFVRRRQRAKFHVALLVDEFFGGWDTAIGGYGALARKYICRFVPDEKIQIDLLLGIHAGMRTQQKEVDQTMIYRLSGNHVERQRWLDQRAYNLFLSIEMTEPSFRILKDYQTDTPLLYWIQDPRELRMYQSRLQTVNRLKDDDWAYVKDVSEWIQDRIRQKRVSFISQGQSLSAIARQMYHIPDTVPIQDSPIRWK